MLFIYKKDAHRMMSIMSKKSKEDVEFKEF